MRELVASTTLQKPIIALTDPDASRGGMSLEEVHTQLIEADALAIKWGFHGADTPSSGTECIYQGLNPRLLRVPISVLRSYC